MFVKQMQANNIIVNMYDTCLKTTVIYANGPLISICYTSENMKVKTTFSCICHYNNSIEIIKIMKTSFHSNQILTNCILNEKEQNFFPLNTFPWRTKFATNLLYFCFDIRNELNLLLRHNRFNDANFMSHDSLDTHIYPVD